MKNTERIEMLKTEELYLDRENPRLAEYGITKRTSERRILSILWEAMDVMELVQSIQAGGYFLNEPLIVIEENERRTVIEGNRRLVAVRLLLDPSLAKQSGRRVPRVTKNARNALETLPAIISSRQDSWRYLGFKHINGPAKWTSYAKAKYIADVHHKYSIPIEDIANQIGDRHGTVQRLYRGLMVIEQAEAEGVYHIDDRFRRGFAFSHLYMGLDYDGISKFLSLKSADIETSRPVPQKAIKNLGELCIWLYGSKKENTPPIITSQNPDLGYLDRVLMNREAIAALRAGTSLEVAHELSRPSMVVLEDALMRAKRELRRAQSHLTTGYQKSEELLNVARTVSEMADDICSEMYRKKYSAMRSRSMES